MRSYLDIIIDLQDGKEVLYEEAKLAALAGNHMLRDAENNEKRLTGYGTNEQREDFKSKLAISLYESRFKSKKLPIDKYLGSYHPSSPDREKDRETSKKIYEKFLMDFEPKHIKEEDLKITVTPYSFKNDSNEHPGGFITIKHIPSGVACTGEYKESQVVAKKEIMMRLDANIGRWLGADRI